MSADDRRLHENGMRPMFSRATYIALLCAAALLGMPLAPAHGQFGWDKSDRPITATPYRDPKVKLSVNLKFTLIPPPRKAILLMLPGGHGRLNLVKGRPTQLIGNFLVKERKNFVRTYFITALMDAADDLQHPPFLFGNYRRTRAHSEDVRAAMDKLAATYANKPIFVLGMSSGATGAANAGYWIGQPKIKGIVLFATPTQPNTKGVPWVVDAPIEDNVVPLGELGVPVLFVHHQDDQCELSPHAGVQALVTSLTAAGKDATLLTITGGTPDANECESGLGHHSFQDRAPEVISAVLSWIETKLY